MSSRLSSLGSAGSLRQVSYNRAIRRAAQKMVPFGAQLEIFDLAGFPCSTRTWSIGRKRRSREFRAAVRTADALLIATPKVRTR